MFDHASSAVTTISFFRSGSLKTRRRGWSLSGSVKQWKKAPDELRFFISPPMHAPGVITMAGQSTTVLGCERLSVMAPLSSFSWQSISAVISGDWFEERPVSLHWRRFAGSMPELLDGYICWRHSWEETKKGQGSRKLPCPFLPARLNKLNAVSQQFYQGLLLESSIPLMPSSPPWSCWSDSGEISALPLVGR